MCGNQGQRQRDCGDPDCKHVHATSGAAFEVRRRKGRLPRGGRGMGIEAQHALGFGDTRGKVFLQGWG